MQGENDSRFLILLRASLGPHIFPSSLKKNNILRSIAIHTTQRIPKRTEELRPVHVLRSARSSIRRNWLYVQTCEDEINLFAEMSNASMSAVD